MLIFIFSRENEEVTIAIAGGLLMLVAIGISQLIRAVLKKARYSGVRSILKNTETGEWGWCYPKEADDIRETMGYEFPRWTDELKKQYPQSMWSSYFVRNSCSSDVGNFRYAPKSIWKQFKQW